MAKKGVRRDSKFLHKIFLMEAEKIRKNFIFFHGRVDDLIQLPAVIEHYRIHPNTRVKPQLTVVMGGKGECSVPGFRKGRHERSNEG